MVRTYRHICRARGIAPSPVLEREVFHIGDAVFDAPYRPYEEALRVLEVYRKAGHPMALCTKGDPSVQWERKIFRHRLHRYFDAVHVVPQKGRDQVLAAYHAVAGDSGVPGFMIGDSLRDDVRGGRMACLSTVWVRPHPEDLDEAWVWEHGFEDERPTHVVDRIDALPQVLPPFSSRGG